MGHLAIAPSYVALLSREPLHCKLLLAVGRHAVVLRATLSAAAVAIAARASAPAACTSLS